MAQAAAQQPKRMICICAVLGLHPEYFFPKTAGKDYESTPYLDMLKANRNDFTVFSGLSQEGSEAAGHSSETVFLTGAYNPQLPGFHNSISIEQAFAEHVGPATRFPSLVLGTGGTSISVDRSGVKLQPELKASKVFARLFLEGTPDEVQHEMDRLNEGRSILDAVSDDAKSLNGRIGTGDKDKLDEYLTSVRDMERRLQDMQAWSRKPKPKVSVPMPHDPQNIADEIGKMDLLFDLMPLALQTDSTRAVSIVLGGDDYVIPIPGVTMGHHALSHHGQEPMKIEQLRKIEEAQMASFSRLLTKLKSTDEAGVPLLNNTAILFGSNLGNASSHSCTHVPIILAGGTFKHGQHIVAAPHEDMNTSKPLAKLFVSMLQASGVQTDKFAHATGTMPGLEMV